MEKNYLTDSEIINISKSIGIKARSPRGNDCLYTFWNAERCIAVVSPSHLHDTINAFRSSDDLGGLLIKWLREQETQPRFYK